MKERPINFRAPMVNAILGGRKTQERRAVKPCRERNGSGCELAPCEIAGEINRADPDWSLCPYGKPGARLWVREGWAQEHPLAAQAGRYSQAGQAGIPGPPAVKYRVIYRADGEPLQVWRNADQSHPYFTLDGPSDDSAAKYPTVSSNYKRDGKAIYWESPIHMPRWASRITLEITGVRVEKLKDISEEDAQAEGASCRQKCSGFARNGTGWSMDWSRVGTPSKWGTDGILTENDICLGAARHAFANYWESINGPDSWEANPWVWVIEFKRVAQ